MQQSTCSRVESEEISDYREATVKILVIGGGGREHAMIWRLRQSPEVEKIWCAPGNGGVADIAECGPVDAGDVGALVAGGRRLEPDFYVGGAEAALVAGGCHTIEWPGQGPGGPS